MYSKTLISQTSGKKTIGSRKSGVKIINRDWSTIYPRETKIGSRNWEFQPRVQEIGNSSVLRREEGCMVGVVNKQMSKGNTTSNKDAS